MRHLSTTVSLALACACFAAGCGGSAPEKKKAAAESPAAVSPVDRLTGQWQGTFIVDEESVQGKLKPKQIEALRSMQVGMEFHPDGKLVLAGVNNGKPYESAALWELVSQDGDNVTIRSTEASGKTKEIVILFENDDAFVTPLKTEVANLGAMRFERLR